MALDLPVDQSFLAFDRGEYGINTALASLVAYLLTAGLVFSRAKRHGWTLAQAELTRIQ